MEEFSLSSFLPTSFGKKAEKHDYEGAINMTRKKKVQEKAYVPKEVGPKAPAPVYEYGLYCVSSSSLNQGKYMPHEPEIQMGDASDGPTEFVEVDEENPYKIPYAYEVEMKGHGGVVTALALGESSYLPLHLYYMFCSSLIC